MGRGNLAIDMNDHNAQKLFGFLESFSTDFGRTKNMSPIVQKVFSLAASRFERLFDGAAAMDRAHFHHAYEWNMVGVPQARLFETVMVGTGNSRQVTFRWKASKTTVPVPSLPPSKSGKQLMEGVHIFVWKAPIMEYSIPVTIGPVISETLAFPGSPGHGGKGLYFTRKEDVRITNPGGKATTGAVTGAFLAFWTGAEGDKVFQQVLADIAQDHDATMLKTLSLSKVPPMKAGRAGKKQARELGKKQAERFYSWRNGNYIEQARRRKKFILRNAAGGTRFD